MKGLRLRAWNKRQGNWIDKGPFGPTQWGIDEDGEIISEVDGSWVNNRDSDDYIVELSTGLKDKNGKEIFGGDIVVWNTGEKFVVRWFAPHAKFLYRYIKKGYGIDNDAGSHEVEVIGNIHENPEQLK